ncbi:MAG TPA: NTP transferase domain-containing protein [Pyrinomonadaceae bacterium]|nr:NTP transferase domain-containing protein [Pyrinomonadaceae bacterium]
MFVSELKIAVSDALSGEVDHGKARSFSKTRILDYLVANASSLREINSRSVFYLFEQQYGTREQVLSDKLTRLLNLCDLFLQLYDDGPVTLLRAPARIGVLGEHVDYVSYIPSASLTFGSREHDMLMLYRGNETGRVRGASTARAYPPIAFALDQEPAHPVSGSLEDAWLSYLYQNSAPAPHWDNYVKGAAYFARMKFGGQVQSGFDFAVDSSIPPAGGASSSSALVVLAGAAIREVNHIKSTPEELAVDSARAEWYVGTRGGVMDHTTMCLTRASQAVLISYAGAGTRRVFLPGQHFQWITFFSTAADKGRAVMIEYNERVAVSRLLIPAVIDGWRLNLPARHSAWHRAIDSYAKGSVAALEEIEALLRKLPETLTLNAIERNYPEAFAECSRAFPALVKERRDWPLKVRSRALHHLGEVRRVALATLILDSLQTGSGVHDQTSAMQSLGDLLNQSHQSLRELYNVSTPEVEELIQIIRSDPNVYGTRLMGGGFGGNVLTLTGQEYVSQLTERVQAEYYEPRHRHGIREGSVLISTPGNGLLSLSFNSVWREAIEEAIPLACETPSHITNMIALLDALPLNGSPADVWPVIVAAGRGTRAKATGLEVPKPLALLDGKAAVVRVLQTVREALGKTHPPIVIVSPETEAAVREALTGEEVILVSQPVALGTGDAVLRAQEQMINFQGLAFVVWGTQPVIRGKTMQRTVKLATVFDDYDMVVSTTVKEHPYAPLQRDKQGQVRSARETNLEGFEGPTFGETNVGLFVLKSQVMFEILNELRRRHWDELHGHYKRPGHELAFPNELINYLGQRETGVFAAPIADSREEQGIKTLDDIARCEQFISELLP